MKLLFLLGFAALLLIGSCEETTTEEGPIVNTPEVPSPTSVEPDQSTTEEGPIVNTPEIPSPTSVEPGLRSVKKIWPIDNQVIKLLVPRKSIACDRAGTENAKNGDSGSRTRDLRI